MSVSKEELASINNLKYKLKDHVQRVKEHTNMFGSQMVDAYKQHYIAAGKYHTYLALRAKYEELTTNLRIFEIELANEINRPSQK